MTHPIWPLFDLEVATPRITMRYVDDDLATSLAELAADGVHDPSTMPFEVPWTDQPDGQLQRETLRYYWQQRVVTTPGEWHLHFAALLDGEVVGTSSLNAVDFGIVRGFATGSWIGAAYQGRGIGKEMRRASLALGFAGLGALTAHTAAWSDNAASLAVTRTFPYVEEGRRLQRRRSERDEMIGFRMERNAFDQIDTTDIEFRRLDAAREFLAIRP